MGEVERLCRKGRLFVPEGRLRIAQDFSPGLPPGRIPSLVPEGRLRIAQDFSPGPPLKTFFSPGGTVENSPGLQSWAPTGPKTFWSPGGTVENSPGLQSWARTGPKTFWSPGGTIDNSPGLQSWAPNRLKTFWSPGGTGEAQTSIREGRVSIVPPGLKKVFGPVGAQD